MDCFFFSVVFIAVILLGSRTTIAYWVDLLWFRSLGYGDVFWKTSLAAVERVCGVCNRHIRRPLRRVLRCSSAPTATICHRRTRSFVGGQPLHLPIAKFSRVVAVIVAGLISLATGTTMAAQWPASPCTGMRRPAANSIADPIFGRPLNFYLFTLPAWQIISGWLLMLAVICDYSRRALSRHQRRIARADRQIQFVGAVAWRGVSIAVGFLLAVVAMRVYISRFELLFEHHTVFDGVTYTDAHVAIIGLLVVCIALLIGAAVALASAAINPRGRWLAFAVAPAALCYVVLGSRAGM